MIDIQAARQDTPGCHHQLYFNNAGAALMPQPVIEAVDTHFQCEIAHGGYEAALMAEKQIQDFYSAASRLIHCDPCEIAFVENATRAWAMILASLSLQAGDKVLTTTDEYGSNYIALLQTALTKKIMIEIVPSDVNGQICLNELKKRIDPRVKLIALTHVPAQNGLVHPAEAVGDIAQAAGIFYVLDATQSIGQLPVDVNQLQCSALCTSGRKYLRGPRGTGFLYISQQWVEKLDPPLLDLHSARWTHPHTYTVLANARRFETGERSYANQIGLGVAIQYALEIGLETIADRIHSLASLLRDRLSRLAGIVLHDRGKQKCGLVTFTHQQLSCDFMYRKLKEKKISVSCYFRENARLDCDARGLESVVRASVHYYNTEQEVDLFCQAIQDILNSHISEAYEN
jgi:cysteine desulfurase/selenocysteine lyase